MELKNEHEEKKSFSVFKGDELCISRILAREPSKGQSSRIFYRSAEGVPFKWETNPGTPKNPQEVDHFFPLSPSPLMQSIGLSLPNANDHGHETKKSGLRTVIISSLRKKMFKKNIISEISNKVEMPDSWGNKQHEMFKGWTFSSNGHAVDTSTVDGSFCCNPLHVHAILDEGSRKIFYCSNHKTTFEVEEDNSLHGRALSPAMSRAEQLDGEQTSIEYSMWKRARFWRWKRKKTGNVKNGISFRCHENEELEASIRRSSSVSSLSSDVSKFGESWGEVNMGRSVYGSCLSFSPWSRREVC